MGGFVPLQLTWTKPYSTAKVGLHKVNFYNDEGATAIRKVVCVCVRVCVCVCVHACVRACMCRTMRRIISRLSSPCDLWLYMLY